MKKPVEMDGLDKERSSTDDYDIQYLFQEAEKQSETITS